MNKKSAVALAVGAAFAAPVMAQTTGSTLQIYGKLYPEFVWFKSSNATQPGGVTSNLVPQPTAANANNFKGRGAIDVQNSYLGFRGEEKLGGALALIWQIEQSLGFDTGATDFWATRNSFLGLRGGFGTVKLGNMDTIYKEYGDQFSMFGVNSGNFTSASNALSANGAGNSRLARFHERAPNSLQYLSPEFGDFQAGIQYAPDELKGNPGRDDLKADWWSYGVKYEAERLYVSVHQERRKDFFGGSATATAVANPTDGSTGVHSRDVASRLSVAFKLTTDHRLTGDLARLEYKETGGAAGAFEKLEKTNWAVGWEARWGGGPVRTGIQYVHMNEGKCSLAGGVACSTSGLDGNVLNLGAAYDFSKRTFIFGLFSKLNNGESALFDTWANGTPARGSDTTQFAIGVSHSF